MRLKRQEAKLKDFCSQNGRRSDTFRTQKLGLNGSVSSKAVWTNRKTVDNAAKSGIVNIGGNAMYRKAKNTPEQMSEKQL